MYLVKTLQDGCVSLVIQRTFETVIVWVIYRERLYDTAARRNKLLLRKTWKNKANFTELSEEKLLQSASRNRTKFTPLWYKNLQLKTKSCPDITRTLLHGEAKSKSREFFAWDTTGVFTQTYFWCLITFRGYNQWFRLLNWDSFFKFI